MAPRPAPGACGKCPVCGRASEQRYRPFCSRRCADVDLARWLRGAYAIPGETEDSGEPASQVDSPHGLDQGPDPLPRSSR